MRSMVEGDVRIRHRCVAPTPPSAIALGDGPPPRAGEDRTRTDPVSFHC